ncbi:phosphatidylinositol/phosphatidylcholine transfer protein SFH8-like [Andrographis paniculata]|uniref:phosphatidylinositol/phosphatidylcholine transfer protein SFH8-like n=1 Tax=Andrographis paniculata TaxID=175694 RepID=UPI0021E9646C|nr:phosphatidylinositol/phosphatidylcholine transfer protein SFH8-like [Andrographis paniculata]
MGKREQFQKEKCRVESVLELLKKQAPLSVKQEKFCSDSCVERFLKAKGDNVKKAAKQLRSCLLWRDTIGTDNLIADEFSAELAEGVAYVAGHDEESRPVMMFRIKQDYHKFHSQKLFTRLLVFTIEVAVQTMGKNVEQFVILFDASFFRSASAFMNMFLATLKIVADYYPGRLHRAFVIDPPSLFSYLWKGVKPFLEVSAAVMFVASLDYEEPLEFNGFKTASYPRAASLRFEPPPAARGKLGACSSSRFSFTVSHHFDSLKPWYLSLTDTSASKVGPTDPAIGPTISPYNARSFSFASPAARRPATRGAGGGDVLRKGFFPSTPMPQRTQKIDPAMLRRPTTPKPSFLQSPALFFRREGHVTRGDRSRESFGPYLKFYRRPYDEMIYRSKMRPPLGGLISIVSPQIIRRRHVSVSQRF